MRLPWPFALDTRLFPIVYMRSYVISQVGIGPSMKRRNRFVAILNVFAVKSLQIHAIDIPVRPLIGRYSRRWKFQSHHEALKSMIARRVTILSLAHLS
jgi:hypothetical protein